MWYGSRSGEQRGPNSQPSGVGERDWMQDGSYCRGGQRLASLTCYNVYPYLIREPSPGIDAAAFLGHDAYWTREEAGGEEGDLRWNRARERDRRGCSRLTRQAGRVAKRAQEA